MLPVSLLHTIADNSMFAGLALAWGAAFLGSFPPLLSAIGSKPRLWFLILAPALLLLGGFFPFSLLGWGLRMLVALGPGWLMSPFYPILLFLCAYPLASMIAFKWANRQAPIADNWLRFIKWLSFIVVGGMTLLLLGVLLWCFSYMLVVPGWFQQTSPFLLGTCLAFIVAVHTLVSRPRSRDHGQARPHDDSPSNVDSSQEPRGYM